MTAAEVFQELAALPRWVSYRLVWSPTREKFDKIPHTGRHGLSTAIPDNWSTLVEAVSNVRENTLAGVGLVMTGGLEYAGWQLLGFDFDGVDFEHFTMPFRGYAETSPSGTGVRAFAWAPSSWAQGYKDTCDAHPKHCGHAEIYLGTSPRFLTVTFDPLNKDPIPQLEDKDLTLLESWLKRADTTEKVALRLPEEEGKLLNLTSFHLSPEQVLLVSGRGKLDRSAVLHGMLIKLIDAGIPQGDLLATILQTQPLWQYCLDHRHDSVTKAMLFAKEEIARAYDRSHTGIREKLVGYNAQWKVVLPVPENDELVFPMDLYDKAPGLVGEIAHWIIGASYSPREEFAYASALSMVSALIGPYCSQGTRGGKLNLYITLVGETGTGKNEAIDVMGLLLAATEARDCVLDFPASEAALRRQLTMTPNVLLRIDELAHKLESMKNSSNGSSLGRAVLEAYNGARMPPKIYADEKKTLPAVENPYVQILGGTTDKVWDVVKTSHMEDGTLNRFIFVCLPKGAPYRRNLSPESDIPKSLKDRLNAFWRDGKRYDLLGYVPPGFGRAITFGEGVMAAVESLDRISWELQQKAYGSLYTRYALHVIKVASILAVSDGRLEVNLSDLDQAKRFMTWSLANTFHRVGTHMADTNFERQTKRLFERLQDGKGKLAMREAYKYMHITRREMEELISTLVLSGEIEVFKDENPTRGGYYPEWILLTEQAAVGE